MWSLSSDVLGYVEDPPSLLFAIQSGDWQKAWNEATNYGSDVSGITAAWGAAPPPDVTGKPSATVASVLKAVASAPHRFVLKMVAPQAAPAKGKPMGGPRIVLTLPANATAATNAALAQALASEGVGQAATALAMRSPAPTPANPQGGRTLFGVPVVDVGVGAVAVVGLAWLAKAKHWL